MIILRAEDTSLRSDPRSELRFGQLALLPITWSARGQDVDDPVCASALQRDAVIDLERRDDLAVRASAAMVLDEGTPFGTSEASLSLAGARSIRIAFRTKDFGMRPVVGGHDRFVLLAMPRVVEPLRRPSLFRMRFAPTTHRITRLFRVALQPLPRVGALSLRIFVRHRRYLTNGQPRCNRTMRVLSCS
jgi:hypothetical protein